MNQIINYRRIVSKLPTELADLVKSFCNPSEEYWQEKIDDVAKKYGVCRNGLLHVNSHFQTLKPEFSHAYMLNIIKCKNQMPFIFRPLKTYSRNCVGSYGGKHRVEEYRCKNKVRDIYCSNGEFIVAMILAGYEPKTYGIIIATLNQQLLRRRNISDVVMLCC